MKNFAKKLLVFSLFPLIYFGVVMLINYNRIANAKADLKKTKVIIAGDSHLFKAMNSNLFVSATNIAYPREPYVLTYWKLKYLLESQHIDTLILGFSQQNISAYNDLKFREKEWTPQLFQEYYSLIIFNSFKSLNIDVDYKEWYKVLFRKMCLYPHENDFRFTKNNTVNNTSDLSGLNESLATHYSFEGKQLGVSETAISHLDSIVSLCNKNETYLVLVGSPMHKSYYNRIPVSIEKRYQEKKAHFIKKSIKVIDRTREAYPDSLFLDVDHLNHRGAEKFTKEIIEAIK